MQVLEESRDIVNAFNRQTIHRAMFERQQQVFKIKKGLDKNGDTRFSSNCNMLSSVRKNKAPLASTVVLPKFNTNSERMKVSPCNQCNIVGMLVNLIRPTCVNHS